MAKFTNVSGELRFVNHGLRATVAVPADGDLELPDGDDELIGAYACQPDVWAAQDDAAKNAATRAAQAATDAQAAAAAEAAELARLDEHVAAQAAADEAAAAAANTDDGSKG